MLEWRDRLYAFLLKRTLGPFLDAKAAQKLHDSIDFSLQDGRFVLHQVSLNSEHLTEILKSSGFVVRNASVEKLEIRLTLQDSSNTEGSSSSLAWRAYKLGGPSVDTSPGVSLVAEIHIQGVNFEVKPIHRTSPAPQTEEGNSKEEKKKESNTKSRLRNYLDAALASLRLTLRLSDINIRICHDNRSLSLKMSSLVYKDLDTKSSAADQVVVNKSIDFSDILVATGDQSSNNAVLARAQGNGRIYLKIVNSILKDSRKALAQDIEVDLNHQTNISVDADSLLFIQSIMNSMSTKNAEFLEQSNLDSPKPSISHFKHPLLDDEAADREDLKAITGIMKQYKEAYHLAEKNQLRGGILVPSHAYMDELDILEDDEAMTFDVFFDANDQSFYNAASVLRESIRIKEDVEDDDTALRINLRVRLLAAGIKINFCAPHHTSKLREYFLITLNDFSFSLCAKKEISEFNLSIAHFEIEDAHLVQAKREQGTKQYIEIESFLRFKTSDYASDEGDIDNETLLAPAQCISGYASIINKKDSNSTDCGLVLQPVEILARQRSVSNLITFLEVITDGISQTDGPKEDKIVNTDKRAKMEFNCTIPSLTIAVPVYKDTGMADLFKRCGEIISTDTVVGPSIGMTFENLSICVTKTPTELSAIFKVLHIVTFVRAPEDGDISLRQAQRFDVLLLNGRTEIEPCIPIYIQYKSMVSPSKEPGKYFPLVPSIASFKARQEDDDDETSNQFLSSDQSEFDVENSKSLHGEDPQIAMVKDTEKSSSMCRVNIPEVVLDLSKTELLHLKKVLKSLQSTDIDKKQRVEKISEDQNQLKVCCFGLNIGQISISLKEDFCIEDLYGDNDVKDRFSCLLSVDSLKSHLLFNGSKLRHARLLCHDMAGYTALHPRIDVEVDRKERRMEERVTAIKQRIDVYQESHLYPLIYRSKKFSPICVDAPSILLDMRDVGVPFNKPLSHDHHRKHVYLTLYHITYRYDADSDWIERMTNILDDSGSKPQLQVGDEQKSDKDLAVIGAFLSVADCNFDYSSPEYFSTASRSIIRLGDFRFSSNIIFPTPRKQAYFFGLGDLSYHISNVRHSHEAEDKRLCRASFMTLPMKQNGMRVEQRSARGTTAEGLLIDEGFVEILTLDSLNGVLITKTVNERNRIYDEAKTSINLTFGLLSIKACKDSFSCFSSSIGEIQSKLTALTDIQIDQLRQSMENDEAGIISSPSHSQNKQSSKNANLEENVAEFLLDGYEWTEIEHDPNSGLSIPENDEQASGWYESSAPTSKSCEIDFNEETIPRCPARIIHHHFPFHSISNPLGDGDMGAQTHAGKEAVVILKSRSVIRKLTLRLRFFDGYDWPYSLPKKDKQLLNKKGAFVIERIHKNEEAVLRAKWSREESQYQATQRSTKLMAELLTSNEGTTDDSPFGKMPLPEDRAQTLADESEVRRLARKNKMYLQISANGITLKLDAYDKSETHRLDSILSASVSEMFIAETTSLHRPIKMLGEWVNENEHPRDTRSGTLMLKMITWKPRQPLTVESMIANDECEATLQLLPMRAIVDQRAINFIQAFFHNEDLSETKKCVKRWSDNYHMVPPPRFGAFRVKPWKLKVDYIPQKLDVNALRDGSIVELINVSPIDGMVIILSQVSVENAIGFSDVGSGLASNWLQEVVSTQLHKFLANARPFEALSDVGQGISDLIVLPYEAFRNGDDIRRAMASGVKSLAGKMTFQALTTTSRLTEYAASKMESIVGGQYNTTSMGTLPSRPTVTPKGVRDVTGHAMESLARGFQAANYKIVIVPYREYNRKGAAGAAGSIIRGIPIMVVAPMTGATEALSYTLLGARNALRPDIRREEEASHTGFTKYDV